jgi:RimJ/RimL family protein N-acetyltransferase
MWLRDVIEADLPIFFEHQQDPQACRMADFPSRERDAFMTHWHLNVLGNATGGKKTVVVDGAVAGNVVSWEQEGKRLVGYWIGREHWRRGIATAALSEYPVHHETRRPLHAYVSAHNLGSIRVLEKCGFHRVDGESSQDGTEELLFQLSV